MFDVIGKAPRTQAGECFTINNAGWRVLKDLCFHAAPEVRSQVGDRWNANDGHGLDDAGALALADALESSFDSSAVKHMDALSGQRGAANREDFLRWLLEHAAPGDLVPLHMVPPAKPWLIETARKFVTFLRNCGGFAVW